MLPFFCRDTSRGNPNYFLTYGNGKAAARIVSKVDLCPHAVHDNLLCRIMCVLVIPENFHVATQQVPGLRPNGAHRFHNYNHAPLCALRSPSPSLY